MSGIRDKNRIFIGTSGWMYDHWKEEFYPKDISDDKLLNFYSSQFKTVEINNTFYKLPNENTVKGWYENTNRDFIFSVKANRYITHMKNLKECEEPIKNLLERILYLKDKLGPILFQLPPQWHKNYSRLENFLRLLPKEKLFVIELRHPSWFSQDIYTLLEEEKIAFCIHDITGEFISNKITTDFVYIRFHGPEGNYHNKYSNKQIKKWARKIFNWHQKDLSIFVYFNNDAYARAPKNAFGLIKELEEDFDLTIN